MREGKGSTSASHVPSNESIHSRIAIAPPSQAGRQQQRRDCERRKRRPRPSVGPIDWISKLFSSAQRYVCDDDPILNNWGMG